MTHFLDIPRLLIKYSRCVHHKRLLERGVAGAVRQEEENDHDLERKVAPRQAHQGENGQPSHETGMPHRTITAQKMQPYHYSY